MSHWTYTKNFPFLILLIVGQLQVNVCREVFSDMFNDIFACLAQSSPFTRPHFNDSEAFFLSLATSQFIELSSYYHVEYPPQWETDKLLNRDRSGKSSPLLQLQRCSENKNQHHWSYLLCSVCLLNRSSRFCNLVLFVEKGTWPYSPSYRSSFLKMWVYLSLGGDRNAYRDRLSWVDTWSMDIVAQHQSQQLSCICL